MPNDNTNPDEDDPTSHLSATDLLFSTNRFAAFKEHIILVDWCHAVFCPSCGKKQIDVDKTRGQRFLDVRCPSCRKDPREQHMSKRERKRQRKEQERQRQVANAKGAK
jgi:hypothetical protein